MKPSRQDPLHALFATEAQRRRFRLLQQVGGDGVRVRDLRNGSNSVYGLLKLWRSAGVLESFRVRSPAGGRPVEMVRLTAKGMFLASNGRKRPHPKETTAEALAAAFEPETKET